VSFFGDVWLWKLVVVVVQHATSIKKYITTTNIDKRNFLLFFGFFSKEKNSQQ
jgi:hypothetical protein